MGQVSFGLWNVFCHPTIFRLIQPRFWDRKYAEKLFSPISSYLIPNDLKMIQTQWKWGWDRVLLHFSLFRWEIISFGIEKFHFWDRKNEIRQNHIITKV